MAAGGIDLPKAVLPKGALVVREPRTHPLATASFILGIIGIPLLCMGGIGVGLFFSILDVFPAILGLVLGIVGVLKISKKPDVYKGKGMASGGIITGGLGVTVGGGLKKAHLAIDVRIIDAKTSQIVAAATVTGSATSVGALGGANIGGRLPVALGGFSKTPTEQAIRTCIQKAVEYIVTKTPAAYYRQK